MGSALTEMIGGCRSGRPMKFGAHVIAIEINVRCCGNIAFHEIDIKALDECSDPQADTARCSQAGRGDINSAAILPLPRARAFAPPRDIARRPALCGPAAGRSSP